MADKTVSSSEGKCPFLKETKISECPAFSEGCPFKGHECPYKNMSHEEAVAMMEKCPHLKEYLAKCPKYNPNKEGCPFEHEGKMDISKCPHFKNHGEVKKEECPFLKEHNVSACPAFAKGCPFKGHECPYKNMSHEEAVAMMEKCPHLKEYLAKCPKYNPNKEGCPFEHEGKMDISKCPHFKNHGEAKKAECPFLKEHNVSACPAFAKGCPFKGNECPYKNMSHEEAVAMMEKCPHLKEYLAKCPKYNPNKEGCPFEHEGKMDISKCPHFKNHGEAKKEECPFLKEHNVSACPAFAKGCPFKGNECPYKNMSHEEAVAMMEKCPHLKEYLAKCPKYNPNKEGCPFEHEGKMDISKCPHFKNHGEAKVAEAETVQPKTGKCPFSKEEAKPNAPGCPFSKKA